MDTKIYAFVRLASTRYHDVPQTEEHESEHSYGHKTEWGKAGIAALKAIAKDHKAKGKFSHNRSGSIDRGYVYGFFSNAAGTKFVYASINDGMNDLYFRTARDAKDYTGGANNFGTLDMDGFGKLSRFVSAHLNS